MRPHLRHSRSYHEWPSATPVIDVVRTVIAAASVVIGGYAALFLALAVQAGDERLAVKDALFFVAIAFANGLVDAVRHWRRHHGHEGARESPRTRLGSTRSSPSSSTPGVCASSSRAAWSRQRGSRRPPGWR